ncbi:MAG: hypothetical protein RLZZ505_404 [Verrucomicrobiota bacterium]|jgi:hypothetical protein
MKVAHAEALASLERLSNHFVAAAKEWAASEKIRPMIHAFTTRLMA